MLYFPTTIDRKKRLILHFRELRVNNLSTVNLGSDPAAGVIERITNSMDAVIERSLNGHDAKNRNPREIVEELFSILGIILFKQYTDSTSTTTPVDFGLALIWVISLCYYFEKFWNRRD